MADPLYEGGYPALHDAANAASLKGQRRFLRALRLRLGGLLLGAVGGALFTSLDLPVIGGWVALVGFVVALAGELYTYFQSPDRQWYEGRAAAESAKTLAWRYAVKGQSFDNSSDDDALNREFIVRIREVLDDLSNIPLTVTTGTGDQITELMRSTRAMSFAERKSVYREGRLEDQREWYSDKAKQNSDKANLWAIVVFAAEGLGILGGVLLITGVVALDLLAVFAAVAATVTAWTQAKQHQTLAIAYGITAQELGSVKSELDSLDDESKWAEFVGEAEEAISREHTLWRASRGLRIRRGSGRP